MEYLLGAVVIGFVLTAACLLSIDSTVSSLHNALIDLTKSLKDIERRIREITDVLGSRSGWTDTINEHLRKIENSK